VIEFVDVSKVYGSSKILDQVSFKVDKGDFLVITGPSGAGKTTLFKLLTGEIMPSSGKVVVDDKEVSEMDDFTLQFYRRRLGIVFQNYRLLPKRTVSENVAFAMEVCGKPVDEIKNTVPRVLEIVNLEGKDNQFPKELSGGEAQRTAIARALVHSPNLLIADEPTGNLDDENTKDIVDILHKVHQMGVTVVLATHDQRILDQVKARHIHLDDGRLVKAS